MSLEQLSDLETKLIGKLRQYNLTDVKKRFSLFDNMDAVITNHDEKGGIYFVDILKDLDSTVLFSVTISFSKDL